MEILIGLVQEPGWHVTLVFEPILSRRFRIPAVIIWKLGCVVQPCQRTAQQTESLSLAIIRPIDENSSRWAFEEPDLALIQRGVQLLHELLLGVIGSEGETKLCVRMTEQWTRPLYFHCSFRFKDERNTKIAGKSAVCKGTLFEWDIAGVRGCQRTQTFCAIFYIMREC